MFDHLVHSHPRKRHGVPLPGMIMSAAVHGVLISTAVVATSHPGGVVDVVRPDTAMTILYPPPEEKAKRDERPPVRQVTLAVRPPGFRTVPEVLQIPTEIPAIDPRQRFDWRDYRGVGTEGGAFDGVADAPPSLDQTRTFVVSTVDEPPERLTGPRPRYPDMLRQAGIEGNVILEFIVDSAGQVEPQSIHVLSASSRAFEAPARLVVLGSRFRPGRIRGVPVRVLVRQSLTFTIEPDGG